MGRNGIAQGFDVLAGAARAVKELRSMQDQSSRRATLSALSASIRRLEKQIEKTERSFAAVSEFCQQTVRRMDQIEAHIADLQRRRLESDGQGCRDDG